ncbi:MAG: protein-L-isoaspartate O-methyltransferase [Proteobacteria bacterium]|nr:protein-L-isoaspartate O-methyltransferase [Pseudomonadota bacterium]MBS0567433.1 protein-L-isoaspartate O-methyltransferase [Pseudomonadota bacterium]
MAPERTRRDHAQSGNRDPFPVSYGIDLQLFSPGACPVDRRQFVLGSIAAVAAAPLASIARASISGADNKVPVPFSWDMKVPIGNREEFVDWAVKNRGEDPKFLAQRWNRMYAMTQNKDLTDERNKRAFLLTPREDFCRPVNRPHAYESAFLDIGWGVTISGPHAVGRMTQVLNVQTGEKVLEIGTGSGYQSAFLSHLTDKCYSIEIIKPLAERTRSVYDELIADGYTEFKAITTKQADGYYGWEENGPFDKIVVTCGIDHIPPPLLKQLKPNGVMVIPVGPPGAQRVLKVIKHQAADGSITVSRSDIFNKIVPFVPFTKLVDGEIKGAHNGDAKDTK